MKKKLLEKIPMEPRTLRKNKKKWTLEARIIDAEGQQVLLVSLYHNEKSPVHSDGKLLPFCRLFMNDKEDMMLDTQTGEWHSKKIETLPDMYSWSDMSKECDIDKDSTEVIETFIPKIYKWDKDPVSIIRHQQEKYRRDKTSRAYDLRVARIHANMNMVDKISLPDDFKDFTDNTFSDSRIAFYKSEKNKRYVELFCAHCGSTFRIDTKTAQRPKHNQSTICESCGSSVLYKAAGLQGDITHRKKLIVMQKTEQGFVSRYFDVTKTSSLESERYKYIEAARAIFDGKQVKTYYNSNGSSILEKIHWWDSNGGPYNYKVTYGTGSLYYKNVDEVLENTTFKYSALKLLAQQKTVINQDDFLRVYESNRFIEYFIKMGLYSLTNEFVAHTWNNAINREGQNPVEILKLPRQQINRLIQMDGNLYALKLLQIEEKEGASFTDGQMKFLSENNIALDALNRVLEHTTAAKAIRYIQDNKAYGTHDHFLSDWTDYIENCKVLKYDTKNEFVLFPRHFKAAHDSSVKAALDIKNHEKDKDFKKVMKEVRKQYTYETKTYAVVIPNTTGEITYEGQQLHHCVGTYIDRVLKKETVILFIRKKEEIDSPFYTMEVRNGTISQVRGKNNCDMTPQVKQFVESFKKKRLIPDQQKGEVQIA